MKKVSATILLILASSALMFVMYIITAMSLLAVVGVPLALALFAGHVWAASLVQKRFENNGWLRKLQFLLCAGAPGIIMGVLLTASALAAQTISDSEPSLRTLYSTPQRSRRCLEW